jgi:hypothetical protein
MLKPLHFELLAYVSFGVAAVVAFWKLRDKREYGYALLATSLLFFPYEWLADTYFMVMTYDPGFVMLGNLPGTQLPLMMFFAWHRIHNDAARAVDLLLAEVDDDRRCTAVGYTPSRFAVEPGAVLHTAGGPEAVGWKELAGRPGGSLRDLLRGLCNHDPVSGLLAYRPRLEKTAR